MCDAFQPTSGKMLLRETSFSLFATVTLPPKGAILLYAAPTPS